MKKLFLLKLLIVPSLLFLFHSEISFADGEIVATLDTAQGDVVVKFANQKEFVPAQVGLKFKAHDTIYVKNNSRAAVNFESGGYLRLASNTTLEFDPVKNGNPSQVSMVAGLGYFFGREPKSAPIVNTPSVTTAIRGTEFAIEVSKSQTVVSVLDGSVLCSNSKGEASIGRGEQALTELGRAPVKSILVNPIDAVQWALYYPKVLSGSDFDNLGQDRTESLRIKAQLEKISSDLSSGEVENAIESIKQITEKVGKSSGKYKEVLYGILYADESIIDLVKNNKARAKELSDAAYKSAPLSPTVLLSRSYVLQAFFDLEGARELTKQLITLIPDSADAFARLSELEMGFANYDAAKVAAEKAVALNPNNGYANATLGFSKLLSRDLVGARSSFESALKLDGSFALASLGSGLTKINEGNLVAGRDDLERAAFLAPGVSVYRSYLGKAFFEEEREKLAKHEYDRAIALDAKDPTPFLYRAYAELSANDPVNALRDVEESITLNNNRAVYRSTLLLDQDLGARSAALSQVYNSLGFSRAAQVEAYRSLNRDYSNYSAHSLLADSYVSILENDASRSEARVANLLAPVSFNLFNHQSGAASLGEYDDLFDRTMSRGEISTEWSSYSDRFEPAISTTGKVGNFGYRGSIGSMFVYGSKHYNFQRLEKAEFKSAYQLSSDNKVSVDISGYGDQTVQPQSVPEDTRLENGHIEVGFLHSFSPATKVIASAGYERDRNRFLSHNVSRSSTLNIIGADGTSSLDDTLLIDEHTRESLHKAFGSAQLITDQSFLTGVFGTEFHHADVTRRESSPLLQDDLGLFEGVPYSIRTHGTYGLSSYDVYNYNTFRVLPWLDLVGGSSYSSVQVDKREIAPFVDETRVRARFNPKLGATFYPTSALTLRSAYFEGLRKSSLEDAVTIEPSQIAGVNQIYTDNSGTRSRSIGTGADYKIAPGSYVGVQGTLRHFVNLLQSGDTIFALDTDTSELSRTLALGSDVDLHGDERFASAYYSQVLTDNLVSNVDYKFEQFTLTDPEVSRDIKEHIAALTFKYFDESGLFPYVTSTWRRQDRSGSVVDAAGRSNFCLVDVGVGYRIPERHGNLLLEVSNLFDRDFTYDSLSGSEETLHNGVGVTLRAVVNF